MTKYSRISLLLLLLCHITACAGGNVFYTPMVTQSQSPLPTPERLLYVVTGTPVSLLLVNRETWQIVKRISLPESWFNKVAVDPLGRIWIGFAGGHGWSDNRMLVFAPDGTLIHTLSPCGNPDSGVHFTKDKAFVVCDENGFYAEIAILNLTSFARENRIRLDWPDGPYTVYGSNSGSGSVFIFGVAPDKNPQWDSSYTAVALLNTSTQEIYKFVPSFVHSTIDDAVYYQGQYYLLNAASWRSARDNPTDIMVVRPSDSPSMTMIAAPTPAPTFGVLISPFLYMYHNPEWQQAASSKSSVRTMSRLNLETGEGKTWELPDNWNAQDMEIIDGKIVLAYPGGSEMFTTLTEAGLYEFNPEDGQLHLLVAIPKAARIALPK